MHPTKSDPSWKHGPLALTGNWEPLIFRRRINLGPANRAELYAQEHTPELVRRLKDLGLNLIITHYFKGFGLKAEADDIAQARTLLRLCHARGIKVGAYIGDTIILETMLAEEPEAKNWHQVMPDGSPIYYGGTQSFRFRWCITNPAYLAYMKRVLAQTVQDGFDLIHLDNFLDKPEPMSCHCQWCRDAFRAFLLDRMNAEKRKERLGFADVSHVIPPVFSTPLYIEWPNDVITNPLLQEWIRFKCRLRSDCYRQLAEFCRSLNPAIAMECNPTGIWGENSAYMRAVDHANILPHGEFFWDESPNPYGLLKNGALCTHIRGMKMGEQFGDRAFYYSGDSAQKLAEGLAFNNGCIGMLGTLPGMIGDLTAEGEMAHEKMFRPYVALLWEKPEIFCGTKSMARIAVYRNPMAMAFNSLAPQLQAILAEETLLENHIPFDIILRLKNLDYRALIVPGLECLARDEVARLKAYAQEGGRLILVGQAGRYDDWRREWTKPPFEDAPKPTRHGRGWIVKVPELQLPAKAPALNQRAIWDECYKVIDARFWILPKNARLLLDALGDRTLGELTPVQARAPRTTMIEPRSAKDGTALYIHIIRYAGKHRNEQIAFRVPAQEPIKSLSLIVPGAKDRPLRYRRRDGEVSFTVAMDGPYGVAAVMK